MKIKANATFPFFENIQHYAAAMSVEHGKPNTIPHRLGFIPVSVQVMGRVGIYALTQLGPQSCTITPRLLSTAVSEIKGNEILVSDASLFREGDSVEIGGYSRKIQSIWQNTLFLDLTVGSSMLKEIHLATETIQLLIF